MNPTLTALLAANHGVIRRRNHREVRHAIDAAHRRGELVRLLPDTYATPAVATTLEGRARAACLHDPDAVVTGDAAAWLTGFPIAQPKDVEVSSPRQRRPAAGYVYRRRAIPPHLVRRMKGYRVSSRALTALDASPAAKDPLGYAMRKGTSVQDLEIALAATRRSHGNGERRERVAAARDNPWSSAERRAHAALRRGRVSGWRANLSLADRDGIPLGYGDLVFPDHDLIIELDGPTHDTPEAAASDAGRDLALRREGWEVIRFGVDVLDDHREFVAIVRDLVRTRGHRRHGRVDR